MSNKPLQYEPLKIVLKFMDPNLRIQLCQRLPSIRLTDKAVPLRIKKLSFDRRKVHINDTCYAFATYRAYPLGSVVPKFHQRENDSGGYFYDLDEFGYGVNGDDAIPGDIVIGRRTSYDFLKIMNQEDLERHIAIYEKALAEKIERGQMDDHVENIIHLFGKSVDHDLVRTICFKDALKYTGLTRRQRQRAERGFLDRLHGLSGKCLQYNIENFKTDILPDYCRRDNVPAAFTPLIMMTIEKNEVQKHVYRYMYHVKLQAGVRHLCNVIFGGRRHPVEIGTLQLKKPGIIISLPTDLKMKVRNLTIPGYVTATYESFKNLLHKESFPLESLVVRRGIEAREDYEHGMVKTANRLVVYRSQLDNVLEIISNIRNPDVDFKCFIINFPVEQQVQLVRNWMESDRRPGTRLSYPIHTDTEVEELMNRVNNEFPRVFDEDGTSVIPMQGTNCLQVICDENLEARTIHEEHYEPKWTVTLRVQTRS